MDPQQALNDLDQANRAASFRPPLPSWVPPVFGLLTAASITVAGLAPSNTWWRLATLVAGVAIAVSAGLLILAVRARQGIKGVRGPARKQWTTLVICGVAILISLFNSQPQMRWAFAGVGIAGGIAMWIVLRRRTA
jgi:membrane associated rhomboid family serine protease